MTMMKSRYFSIMAAAGFALALATACPAQSTPAVAPPPPPPRNTPVNPTVPWRYIWDGFEFVGRGGNQYFYLGPNNVWMAMDDARLGRFHEFQLANPNWERQQIRNTRYFLIQHAPRSSPGQNNPPQ